MGLYFLTPDVGGLSGAYVAAARRQGLLSYLRMINSIRCNADDPEKPYGKVYSVAEAHRALANFRVPTSRGYAHAPPLPIRGWPG